MRGRPPADACIVSETARRFQPEWNTSLVESASDDSALRAPGELERVIVSDAKKGWFDRAEPNFIGF